LDIDEWRADLQGIIPISRDTLVDREEIEVQAIVIPLIEQRQDVGKNSRVYPLSALLQVDPGS